MNDLNQIILGGVVNEEPEFKKTERGTDYCSLNILVRRSYEGHCGIADEENFIDLEFYGLICDGVKKYARKGRGVRAIGRFKQERWQDADGKAHSKLCVICEHVEYKPLLKKNQEDDV